MTEYERGFIDGIKSKVSAELTPTLIDVSKTMLEILKPVLSTALENALNDNNAITDTGGQPVKRGRWLHFHDDGIIFCSECEREAYWDSDGQQLFDYCPYCGADMSTKG